MPREDSYVSIEHTEFASLCLSFTWVWVSMKLSVKSTSDQLGATPTNQLRPFVASGAYTHPGSKNSPFSNLVNGASL